MITKLDIAVGLSVDEDESSFKKVFGTLTAYDALSPYQCFSNKELVVVGDKTYMVDYSFVIKEVEK